LMGAKALNKTCLLVVLLLNGSTTMKLGKSSGSGLDMTV